MAIVSSSARARGEQLVYGNGSLNGTVEGWDIFNGYSVSDSFAASSATTLTSLVVGVWIPDGAGVLDSVSWSIGSAPFSTSVATGDSSANYTSGYYNSENYFIETASIPISGAIGPGTYYLTLSNATTTGSPYDVAYWDQNSASSLAYQSANGGDTYYSLAGSEYFQIYGAPQTTPEPSTLVSLLSGLPFLAGAFYLRRRKAKT